VRSTQNSIQQALVLSSGVKKWGPEVDHSPSPNAKVKYAWSYTYTPPCLHGILHN
jgi:hypothetical protein